MGQQQKIPTLFMTAKEILLNTLIFDFYKTCKLHALQRTWRKRNKHNKTRCNSFFLPDQISVGEYSYGDLNLVTFGQESRLIIGRFVSIAKDVYFFLDSEHYSDRLTTFPVEVEIVHNKRSEAFGKGDIIVHDDVWIGFGSKIMSGVEIGQGAIIAAGSIVTKNVEPYSIVGGVPARHIKYRFSPEILERMKQIDYSKVDSEFVKKNLELFVEPITTTEQVQKVIDLTE